MGSVFYRSWERCRGKLFSLPKQGCGVGPPERGAAKMYSICLSIFVPGHFFILGSFILGLAGEGAVTGGCQGGGYS